MVFPISIYGNSSFPLGKARTLDSYTLHQPILQNVSQSDHFTVIPLCTHLNYYVHPNWSSSALMSYLLFSTQEPERPFEHKLEYITVQTLQWLPTTLRIKTKVIKACKTSLTPCYLYDLLSYSSSEPGGSTTPTSLQFRRLTAPVLGPLLLLFLLPGKLFPRGLMADSLTSFKFLLK